MEAKELRIGNILLCAEREIPYRVTAEDILVIDDGSSKSRPVPLTEEILLKCPQFVFDDMEDTNDDNTWFWFRYRSFSFGADKSSNFESVFIRLNKEVIEIKYLHDLQNIVKSLTNTELTVNL